MGSKIRRLFVFVFLLSFVFVLPAVAKRATHSFHISRLLVNLPLQESFLVEGRIPMDEVRKIFSQEFTYLGRGSQAFVFSSHDKKYVLKLLLFDSPKDTIVRQFFHTQDHDLNWKIEERAIRTLHACQTAYQFALEETGLIYVHLRPTEQLLPMVRLMGPSWKNTKIPLDSFRFVLQLRAQPFDQVLMNVYQKQDREHFRCLINEFLFTLSRRIAHGVLNTDPTLFDNFGFLSDRTLEIDFGNYIYRPERSMGLFAQEEKARYTRQLLKWTEENAPKWKEDVALIIQKDL